MVSETNEAVDLLRLIEAHGGSADANGWIHLPADLGTGYVRFITPLPGLTLMLQHYELNKALAIKRGENKFRNDTLIFSFRNIRAGDAFSQKPPDGKPAWDRLPSVQVSTSDIALEIHVPARIKTSNLIIGIETGILKRLLRGNDDHAVIRQIVDTRQPYLYEEIVSPRIQAVAGEIFRADASGGLAHFFYRMKAEELIYHFLSGLMRRGEMPRYAVNQTDIHKIYGVRDRIIAHPEVPPQLESLARDAYMSVGKLGKLFRQVFGDSIYNYYQKLRMQQAAFLLREEKLSVSETGYRLGFSNLSHFTRLFEKHMGMKPKKYSGSV